MKLDLARRLSNTKQGLLDLRQRWWTYPVVFVLGGIVLTDEHVPSPSDVFEVGAVMAVVILASLVLIIVLIVAPSEALGWLVLRVRRVWKRRRRGN